MDLRSTTAIAVCFRVFVAIGTRTFFQPDEFFQSLEVAHHAVFGYGHLTWEWKADPPIRSIAFPALYIPVYWFLKLAGLDNTYLLILGPKLFQAFLAALTDVSVYVLSYRILGKRYASTAFLLSLSSFFHMVSLTRTFSNSVETSFTAFALTYWPWGNEGFDQQAVISLMLAAITCTLRPTNAIIWIFLVTERLYASYAKNNVKQTMVACAFIGCIVGILSTIADSLYFGRFTITPFNFLRTNISSVSSFYGRSPWHYYVSQGIPILCTVCLPFLVLGSLEIRKTGTAAERRMLTVIAWTVAIYSFASHKEWRFIHPLLPLMHVISSKAIVNMESKYTKTSGSWLTPPRSLIRLFLSIGIIPGLYVILFHSRAQIEVMLYLRSLNPQTQLKSVGFIMPCHSTPWHSYLHRPELADRGVMWALGCEPPLQGQSLSTYKDQTDIFYQSPETYFKSHFPSRVDPSFPPSPNPATMPGSLLSENWEHRWPSHIVLFGALLSDNPTLLVMFENLGYVRVWIGRNGWEEDSRRRGGIEVWAWKLTSR